jgi:hypothetical protein
MGSRSSPPEGSSTDGLRRLALVTTPRSLRSGIGDYTRHLLPYLGEHFEIELFVEPQHAGEEDGTRLRSARELAPRDFDQILYQLGNERAHAFMLPLIAGIGGTVVLHDWVLFDLVCAARPVLAQGGLPGHVEALRAGGWEALRAYTRSRRAHPHDLSADRFELPLNRSVVRLADGFIVHNAWMRRCILRSATPGRRSASCPTAPSATGAKWIGAGRGQSSG